MKANWSAALRTLDVTTTSMPLLPLELAGGGDPGATFLFLGMVDSPLRQPTGILALFFQSLHVASEKPVQFSSVYISVIFRVFPLSHVATDYYGVDAREGDTSNF